MLKLLVMFLFLSAEYAIATITADIENIGFLVGLENYFQAYVVEPVSSILFFDVAFFTDVVTLPFILVWLISGAFYLTLKMRFINLRGFRHAIEVTRGKYDHKGDPGEISHFQALASAISATVGLGNIAGVALAVSIGGPGAIFWMVVAGLFGMTSKFVECTLAVKHRQIDADGSVLGGPMRYLTIGFQEKGYPRLGKFFSAWFCVLCIGGSLGGGNMFQANQAYAALSNSFSSLQGNAWIFGIIISFFVAVVIIGGIKRIGIAAGVIVPTMCVLYLLSCAWILISNYYVIPEAFMIIWRGAFSPEAGYGGVIGVLITGFRRAAFSNEAGIGSAAIAHSAAATKEPIREGVVALLEPFIDTVVICTMTGLTVVVTGAYKNSAGDGVLVASEAFSTVASFMPTLLSIAVLLFAYSTMISWSYYGERCWAYLFNTKKTLPYKLVFISFSFLGSVFALGPVLEFSDLMILGMAFPNMLGIVMQASLVKKALDDYWRRYKSGEMIAEIMQSHALEDPSAANQFLKNRKA
jgi:alanine or glycine:cation symporter, AGCS family